MMFVLLGLLGLGIGSVVKTSIIYGTLLLFAALFWKAIIVAIFIFIYELLLRFDLYGSINTMTKAFLTKHNQGSINLVGTNEPLDKDSAGMLFNLNSPLKAILNLNRGLLYAAFFIFVITSFPLNMFYNLNGSVFATVFYMFNQIIYIEFPAIMVLILLVVADKFSSLLISLSDLLRS